ncbi:MAG TPA: DNA methyltransferase [Candidatus Sulfotelmatobacter sp.]|nr:DNA methyltransferase [Candidatus Sulfotelmatobacter sp.]
MHSAPAKTLFSSAQVAERAGIHKDTLLRWLRQGVVQEPKRDRHGWRIFTPEEAARIEAIAKSEQPPSDSPFELRDAPGPPAAMERLGRIDWDFREAKTSYLTHGLHPYPAKFIPQIPNALIQELSDVGSTVGDIFCGSGTTLVEGMLLKRNVVGVDANPLACLISAAKTARLQDGDKDLLMQLAQRSGHLADEFATDVTQTLFPVAKFVSKAPRPAGKAIDFWFEPFITEELAEILSWCRKLPTESARNIALASFSAIVVNVSRQDSDTRYVRRAKKLCPGDAFRRFAQVLSENANASERFTDILEPNISCKIFHADLLSSPEIPMLDLVVCSPPYPNAFSYHLYHMTRMVWLGMNQPEFKKREIGSHRKFSSKGRNGATIETFQNEMVSIFGWLKKMIRQGGHACFVVGNSIIRGQAYDNAMVLTNAASVNGFTQIAALTRNLKDTAKAFNPKIGKIKTEKVLIYQNSSTSYL